jgi:hypothetical protein
MTRTLRASPIIAHQFEGRNMGVLRRRWAVIELMLLLSAVMPSAAGDDEVRSAAGDRQVGYGLLNIRVQSAYQSLRLGILPRTPSTLGRGEHQLRIGATWSNIWAIAPGGFDPERESYGDRLLDYETLDGHFSYAYGATGAIQLEAEYEQRWRSGGALDGVIEGFHDLIGVRQNGRDLVPRNGFRIFLDPRNGGGSVDLGAEFKGSYTKNLLVTFHHVLTEGTAPWPAISYAVTGRYSGADASDGTGWDVAVSVGAARRFGRFYVYLSIGYAWYSNATFYGIELPDAQITVLAAGEWRFKPRMSLILEWARMQSPEANSDFFPEVANQIVIGWKWELRRSGVLEIGMLQNAVPYDASPDFGAHAAFTQRF